jgi:hypothetical protein
MRAEEWKHLAATAGEHWGRGLPGVRKGRAPYRGDRA